MFRLLLARERELTGNGPPEQGRLYRMAYLSKSHRMAYPGRSSWAVHIASVTRVATITGLPDFLHGLHRAIHTGWPTYVARYAWPFGALHITWSNMSWFCGLPGHSGTSQGTSSVASPGHVSPSVTNWHSRVRTLTAFPHVDEHSWYGVHGVHSGQLRSSQVARPSTQWLQTSKYSNKNSGDRISVSGMSTTKATDWITTINENQDKIVVILVIISNRRGNQQSSGMVTGLDGGRRMTVNIRA